MIAAVLAGFVVALVAPVLARWLRGASGWVLALAPAGIFAWLAMHLEAIGQGQVILSRQEWLPSLGISLSFRLDGLSLLFALIITGIGVLVVIYGGGYLHGHPALGRFYATLLMFMGSMLGVVLSDNLITIFVFWELTSLTSYLLIGFDHHRAEARAAALQALLVTALGGLVMLAGFVLLGKVTGSYEISTLLASGDVVRGHALYLPILLLVLAGAFTKSAQVPFHFWLPNAMEAPTPVSAYLHAATMVKAGVYLLARLAPVLGGTSEWNWLVGGAGAVTWMLGAWLAILQNDLKRILAYSTVSALGALVFLLGLDTPAAAQAMVVFLLAHALYKGALFLIAGAVDHETGSRDIRELGGLRAKMPLLAACAGAAALSLAGLPPLFGFLAKEIFYEAALHSPWGMPWTIAAAVTGGALLVATAGMVAFRPFFGEFKPTVKSPHEAPWSLLLGPAVLSIKGLVFGLAPGALVGGLLSAAAGAVRNSPNEVQLALWHGFTPVLGLSALTVALGAGLYFARDAIARSAAGSAVSQWGPGKMYDRAFDGLMRFAALQTRILQSGYLRYYLLMTIGTVVVLAGHALATRAGIPPLPSVADVHFYEWALGALMLMAAVGAVRATSRLAAVASLGVVGFGVALVYILHGAPDLAMTQFLIETLMVLLFVLVLYHLPRFATLSSQVARARDLVVSLAAGGLMTLLVLLAISSTRPTPLTDYFAEHSLPAAHGRNVVNVILVDFRGLDTLGEITVLAVAAVGVYALLKLRWGKEDQ